MTMPNASTLAPPADLNTDDIDPIDIADVQDRIRQIIVEMNVTHKERSEVIEALWVSLVAGFHTLLISEPGNGKSFLIRDLFSRILGADTFHLLVDEGVDRSQAFGGLNLKEMSETGRAIHFIDNMLPEADLAEIDEIFNGSAPFLHSLHGPFNERRYQHGSELINIPLWSVVASTNKEPDEIDLLALWDRLHIRLYVPAVTSRSNMRSMVEEHLRRRRGDTAAETKTTITLRELKAAQKHALSLWDNAEEKVVEIFDDLLDELRYDKQILISPRRFCWSSEAAGAAAFIKGHDAVKQGDLDVVRHMWWQTEDQREPIAEMVLDRTNPTRKQLAEHRKDFSKLTEELRKASAAGTNKTNIALEVYRGCQTLRSDVADLRSQVEGIGGSTDEIDSLLDGIKEAEGKAAGILGVS